MSWPRTMGSLWCIIGNSHFYGTLYHAKLPIPSAFPRCAPNTSKQPCHTTEYTDKVKYLILQAAKSFWICTNTGEVRDERVTGV